MQCQWHDQLATGLLLLSAEHSNTCVISTTISVSGGDKPTASVRSDIGGDPYTWILDFSKGTGNGFAVSVAGFSYTLGAGLTNCDRHYIGTPSTIESCQAHFTGMQNRYASPSPHWADWGSEVCANGVDGTPPLPLLSTDGTYNNQLTQPNEVVVSSAGGVCH